MRGCQKCGTLNGGPPDPLSGVHRGAVPVFHGTWCCRLHRGRRCARGNNVPVDDTDHISAKNWLFPGATKAQSAEGHRVKSMSVAAPLVPVEVSAEQTERYAALLSCIGAASKALPPNVHLLSLDRVRVETTPAADGDNVLLRLHHIYQKDEHPTLSQDTSVDLTTLIPKVLTMTGIKEYPLNGIGNPTEVVDPTDIVLQPLSTRTFVVKLHPNKDFDAVSTCAL
eukprot:m.977427 g.977427  ORF g.977427 m.977427 type:complete len:225 (+) comp23953_c1_seq4:127-801(+)